jgi:hypothetical protein
MLEKSPFHNVCLVRAFDTYLWTAGGCLLTELNTFLAGVHCLGFDLVGTPSRAWVQSRSLVPRKRLERKEDLLLKQTIGSSPGDS